MRWRVPTLDRYDPFLVTVHRRSFVKTSTDHHFFPTLSASSRLPLKSMMTAKFVKWLQSHSVRASEDCTTLHPSSDHLLASVSQYTHLAPGEIKSNSFKCISLRWIFDVTILLDIFFPLAAVHRWWNRTLTLRSWVTGGPLASLYIDEPITIELTISSAGSVKFRLLS